MMGKDEEVEEYINKAFFNGITRLMILREIMRGNDYPYGILKTLKVCHNLHVRKTTKNEIYNILNSMEKAGYVTSTPHLSGAKLQKQYKLTLKGRWLMRKASRVMVRNVRAVKRLMEDLHD